MGKATKPVTAVELQQIKNMVKKDGQTVTAVAKKTGRGYETVKNAVAAKNINDFKRLQQERTKRESEANRNRKQTKKHNKKAQAQAAEKVLANAKDSYTPQQVKVLIDALTAQAANHEERIQTITSLLVESDDNVVSRLYRLENRKSVVRRFLERF